MIRSLGIVESCLGAQEPSKLHQTITLIKMENETHKLLRKLLRNDASKKKYKEIETKRNKVVWKILHFRGHLQSQKLEITRNNARRCRAAAWGRTSCVQARSIVDLMSC